MCRPVWRKNPIRARKSLAVCIMQEAAKPSVECDWFGFAFVWLGPASEYFHCFEVADLRLRVCLQTTIGFDLHLCGTVASSTVNNAYRSDGSLRRRPTLVWRPLFAHLYGSAFVVLRGNSWESTLLNHRLSEVVPAEAPRWQRLSTDGVKKKQNNPLFTVSYFTLFQIVISRWIPQGQQ